MWEFMKHFRDVVVFVQPFIVAITGCITFWLLMRTRPRKFKTLTLQPGSVIINWSGHPLPQAHWTVPCRVWAPSDTPYFNTSSWERIEESIQRLMRQLPQDIQFRLLQGDPNIIIVIPQLAGALAVLLAMIHGKTGGFPTISCPLRDGDGNFYLPHPINLRDVRFNSRQERDISD